MSTKKSQILNPCLVGRRVKSQSHNSNLKANNFKSQKLRVGATFRLRQRSRVIVAMSGGVDSSAAAAILKKQGYDVRGVFMHFWHEESPDELQYHIRNRCCSIEAQEMARRVAQKLNIPFYTLNFRREFKKYVVDYFIDGYKRGLTPNPCVECNKWIKFDFLLKKALALGADYLATGHYARLWRKFPISKYPGHFFLKNKIRKLPVESFSSSLSTQFSIKSQFPIFKLFKAKDKQKDQSYFLYNLTQRQMANLLFPIGNFTKPQVRAMAKKWDLPTAERKESQEICFVLEKDYGVFLKRYLKNIKPGPILNQKGREIGRHFGLPFYTIGQRKNIRLSGGPFYVFGADYQKNILYVTNDFNDVKLFSKDLVVGDVNWISGKEPKLPHLCQVKIRYRNEGEKAKIYRKLSPSRFQVRFEKPVRAITPGQSTVFYQGKEILGGGIIDKIKS